MRKTVTLIAVCLAAACAIALATGCANGTPLTEVESVTLNAPTLTLALGGTGKLVATVMPENADDKTVAWSSSDKGVATVDNDGTVTAVAEGSANITARAGGKTAACAVTVCVHSYSGSSCTKCGFPNPSPASDDVPPQTDGEKTESTPTAMLTIVNNSSYVLYDVEWNGTAISYDGELDLYGSQVAPVFSGRAYINFSFYPKNGDGVKIRCRTDSEIGIASDRTASFTFTDESIVVRPDDYATSRNSLSSIHPYGLVIEDGVVVECYADTVGAVVIPDGVTRIGRSAFERCSGVTSVTIPYGVTSIEEFAFSDCNRLTSVSISNSVTFIGISAFCRCGLTSVTIPDSVTTIGSAAFFGCSNLTVTYNGTLAQWCKTSYVELVSNVKDVKLSDMENLKAATEITIPDSVTSIESFAFSGCNSLTSVTIPDSVTSIGSFAFFGCSSLTSVTIPDSVTSINEHVFYDCISLTSVTIPSSVTYIDSFAFNNCYNLKTIYYGGSEDDWKKACPYIRDNYGNIEIIYNSSGEE